MNQHVDTRGEGQDHVLLDLTLSSVAQTPKAFAALESQVIPRAEEKCVQCWRARVYRLDSLCSGS